MTDTQTADLEYQFRVIYTLDSVTKSRAHFQFVQPDSAEGKGIRNVLVQHKLADHLYPHKPGDVVRKVVAETGVAFSQHNHTGLAKICCPPRTGAAQPENTNRDFCIYHAAHGDYTFSDQWVQKLIDVWSDATERVALKAVRL